MTPLRVLIADDEALARRRLARLCGELPDVELVAECATGDAALAALEEHEIDVAVLDIQMPGLTGLELASAAAELGVEIILVTAHSEHAVEAFSRGVLDYVMKPVEAERFVQALGRARERVARPVAPEAPAAPLERLAVPVRGEVRLFAPGELVSATLDGELVALRVGAETLWTELSLAELELRLAGHGFLRVHRRALLSLRHVARLRPLPTGGYIAISTSGDEVPVSRQQARLLRQRLGL